MIVFCLIVHHLWGRTLNKHNQDTCTVAYEDEGYIKDKLSVALEILSDIDSDIKNVLKEHYDLNLISTRPSQGLSDAKATRNT
jgi:hypothetical protein